MAQRLYPLQALLSVRHYREDAARNALRQQEQAVTGAQRAVALARREAAKIEKHRDIWQENAKREQEHLEDLELEEFATPSRASDDA